jgi:NRAMP (natural resistance-associated macrophage protein)-like metal ion transporter
MSFKQQLRNFGPGALVAAAFIGPGTVTTATLAGANFGYALLWSLVFATLATITLQEMAARFGTITGIGLGEALRERLKSSIWRWPLFALIMVALYLGNAAYQAGNLSGAALGIEAVIGPGKYTIRLAVLAIAAVAGVVLWRGSYKQIEKTLVALVLFMGLAFVATFIVVRPDISEMTSGLLLPSIPDGSLLTIIALIGTTVVPYNLFLHASAAKGKWKGREDLSAARTDTIVAIGLGGLITVFIVSTAAASMFARGLSVSSASDMAVQFEPLFGVSSRYLMGLGFFAAGLSSSITAPLATAYAISEITGIEGGVTSPKFRAISISVLLFGMMAAMTGIKPITIIVSAQFANGLLLPIIAAFLLFAMNQKTLLGDYANGWKANLAGATVLVIAIGLGLRMVARSLGLI